MVFIYFPSKKIEYSKEPIYSSYSSELVSFHDASSIVVVIDCPQIEFVNIPLHGLIIIPEKEGHAGWFHCADIFSLCSISSF